MKARTVRSLALTLTLSQAVVALPAIALAAPTASEKDEARDRFDRGLKLFNEGDNAGALAEFKRAYEIIPNQLVLYNIGLVYAAMNRPAEASDALNKLLADPGSLQGERLARAKQTRDEQAARVAELTVTTNVPASIEVDNVEAGKTPLAAPLRIASGSRIVGAFATGYAPLRKEVTVAGGTKSELKLELVAMEGKAAHLSLHTHLPAAEVLVDGVVVGKTPLATSLTVAPGQHKIGLKRAGYVTAQQDLLLGDGASGDVTLEPEIDTAALGDAGSLALDISESQAVVTIDGKARGIYAASFKLPKGAHQLVVERGGFETLERVITVDTGRTTTVPIALVPTPETRAAYVSHANTQRTWGFIAALGGVAIAGGGATLLVLDAPVKSDARADMNQAVADLKAGGKGRCDVATDASDAPCLAAYNAASKKLSDAQTRDKIGYVMLGVGGAAAALGVYLLVSGDNPHRYDKKTDDNPLAWGVLPVVGATNGLVLYGSY